MAATEVDTSDPSERFDNLARSWGQTCISFFEIIPDLTQQSLKFATEGMADDLETFASQYAEKSEMSRDGETNISEYLLPIDDLPIVSNRIGKSFQRIIAADMIGRGALSALVSELETFLAELLDEVGSLKPEAIVTSEDTISLGELSEFSSFDEAKRVLRARKIEEVLHSKSLVQMLNWIGDKFGVNLTSDKELLADFTEICQRRHLLIHAGGKVNRRYIDICGLAGCDMKKLPALGEQISIDRKYLRRATARVFQVGFFSLHILWQKLRKADQEQSFGSILTTSHDFLENDLTKMCRRVCEFALSSKQKPSDRTKAYLTINNALSYKYDLLLPEEERKQKIDQVLATHDWSIKSPTIKLALACLHDHYDDLADLVEPAQRDGVGYYSAHTWMIF